MGVFDHEGMTGEHGPVHIGKRLVRLYVVIGIELKRADRERE